MEGQKSEEHLGKGQREPLIEAGTHELSHMSQCSFPSSLNLFFCIVCLIIPTNIKIFIVTYTHTTTGTQANVMSACK